MPKCRYCGKPIEFITASNRRMIPVEVEPVYFHPVQSKSETYDKFYTEDGEMLCGREPKPFETYRVKGYRPHKYFCENWKYCNSGRKGYRKDL